MNDESMLNTNPLSEVDDAVVERLLIASRAANVLYDLLVNDEDLRRDYDAPIFADENGKPAFEDGKGNIVALKEPFDSDTRDGLKHALRVILNSISHDALQVSYDCHGLPF